MEPANSNKTITPEQDEKIAKAREGLAKLAAAIEPLDHVTIEEHLDIIIAMSEISASDHFGYVHNLFLKLNSRKDEIPQLNDKCKRAYMLKRDFQQKMWDEKHERERNM